MATVLDELPVDAEADFSKSEGRFSMGEGPHLNKRFVQYNEHMQVIVSLCRREQ